MSFLLLLGLFSSKVGFEALQKSNTSWLVSTLVETEADDDTGCCMLCHLSYETL